MTNQQQHGVEIVYRKKKEYLMIKHMYLTILTIKQLQHENLAQTIKTITKYTKCPLYICSDGVLSGKDEQMKINKLTIMY